MLLYYAEISRKSIHPYNFFIVPFYSNVFNPTALFVILRSLGGMKKA